MAHATEAPAGTMAEGQTSHTLNQGGKPANTFGYTREQQLAALHKLREPFLESEIRYLPRVWCKACRDAKGTCNRNDHERRQCRRCGQTMTTAHIDLKFVGHAEATNRLLNVDPFWDWEPLTTDQAGLPMYDQSRGLWIRLTVCGMTRLGYGNAEGKTGGDAVKEIIGDAIRNAGMRFGMALDLWTSSDLEIIESGTNPPDQGEAENGQPAVKQGQGPAKPTATGEDHLARLQAQANGCWKNQLSLAQIVLDAEKHGVADSEITLKDRRVVTFRELLNGRINELDQLAAQGGAGEGQAA
jgi:hypothetical protein